MSADRFTVPAVTNVLKAAAAAGPGDVTGPATPLRPPGMAIQASILARPPDLSATTATQVTGILGTATPEGDLPLATPSGTLLLRPVPGAWPSDLPAGSSLSVTIGPGARAGNVQSLAAPERAPSVATGTRPPSSGAETALRGLLAAGTDGTVPAATTARPVIATSSAVAAASVPANVQPQAPATPAGNPQLVAAAGAMQAPRTGPALVLDPAPLHDRPRGVAAAQSAQAVPDIAKGAAAGTQDLARQAALAPQDDALAAGQPAALPLGAPTTDPAQLQPHDPSATRPDLVMAQALAHPGMLARMAAFLPRADRLGAAALMLYLFGARNGGVRAWLGEAQMGHLTRAEARVLADIEEAMVPTPRMASDGSVWSTLLVPFMEGDRPSVMLLATMPGILLPPDPEEAGNGQPNGDVTATAFSLGMDLSALGPVQLRGFSLPERVMMDLSVSILPPPPLRDAFEAMVDTALAGLKVPSSLRLHWGCRPFLADLMPDGAAVTCSASA